MLQNDWRDRIHDAQKNKKFVLENLDLFLTVLLLFWLTSVILVFLVFQTNILIGFSFLFILIVGLIYSEVRRIPLASTILVALSCSSPILLPALMVKEIEIPWLIFSATFLFVFGREVMKDIDDVLIDKDYKWTLAVKFGKEKAKIVAMSCIFTAIIITTGTLLVAFPDNFFSLLGVLIITAGIGFFGIGMPSKTARTWLDAGVFLSILGLIIM
jgi:4-hydroxybenzoate polyprenyltransferase